MVCFVAWLVCLFLFTESLPFNSKYVFCAAEGMEGKMENSANLWHFYNGYLFSLRICTVPSTETFIPD